MFNVKPCLFIILSIMLGTASVYSNNTQETNTTNEIPQKSTSETNNHPTFKETVFEFFSAITDEINTTNTEVKNVNVEQKRVSELVNQGFQAVEKRFLESENKISEIEQKQPYLATKEWVTASLNTTKNDLNNSVNKKLEQVPTKEWVEKKINDTYNPLKQELKEQKEAWELYKKTKGPHTLAQDTLSPTESFTIKDYVDASLQKTQETLKKIKMDHNDNNWSTRTSTVAFINQNKISIFALCVSVTSWLLPTIIPYLQSSYNFFDFKTQSSKTSDTNKQDT